MEKQQWVAGSGSLQLDDSIGSLDLRLEQALRTPCCRPSNRSDPTHLGSLHGRLRSLGGRLASRLHGVQHARLRAGGGGGRGPGRLPGGSHGGASQVLGALSHACRWQVVHGTGQGNWWEGGIRCGLPESDAQNRCLRAGCPHPQWPARCRPWTPRSGRRRPAARVPARAAARQGGERGKGSQLSA